MARFKEVRQNARVPSTTPASSMDCSFRITENLCRAALVISIGCPFKCYECRYSSQNASNTGCFGPNINISYLRNCTIGVNSCQTNIDVVSSGNTYLKVILRRCGSTTTRCRDSQVFGIATRTCSVACATEGCNITNAVGKVVKNLTLLVFALVTFITAVCSHRT